MIPIFILGALEAIIYSGTIASIWLIYAIEISTERGFTLIMIFNWLSIFSLEILFHYIWFNTSISIIDLLINFTFPYLAGNIAVLFLPI